MNLVERLRQNVKWLERDGFLTNALNTTLAADRIEQLERKLQAAEFCYKDALERLQGARNAALEQAAKVCDELYHTRYMREDRNCATAIRELKDKP